MNKTIAVTILALAISLVACKSGEVTNEVKTVVVRMMCDTPGCKGEMKPTGVCLTSYPAQWPHACPICKVGRTYSIIYPDKRFEKAADTNWPSQNITNYSATNTYPPIWFVMAMNPSPKELLRIHPSIATNWVSIGTYTLLSGATEDVQSGTIVTNTTAILEWKGIKHEFILESTPGPGVGERRVPKPNQWIQQWGTISTNIYFNDLIPHEQQGFTITNSVWMDHIEATNLGSWYIQGQTNIGIQN